MKKAPRYEDLRRLLEEHPDATQAELAQMAGVSRPWLNELLRSYGLKTSKSRPSYDQELPWYLRPEDDSLWWTRILREAGRIRAQIPGGRKDAVKTLERRVKELAEANAAVTYNPAGDPSAEANGWWPFWIVAADPTDRVLEIPGIGELRLSLAHIPDERLSTHERLLKVAARNGGEK